MALSGLPNRDECGPQNPHMLLRQAGPSIIRAKGSSGTHLRRAMWKVPLSVRLNTMWRCLLMAFLVIKLVNRSLCPLFHAVTFIGAEMVSAAHTSAPWHATPAPALDALLWSPYPASAVKPRHKFAVDPSSARLRVSKWVICCFVGFA